VVRALAGDTQGTTSLDVPDAGGTAGITYQRYKPYGQQRGGDTITTTDHGYLGQIEDTTGLTYLNNRYLDPTLGRFVSVDPLINITRDAYGYARNNPISYSDPSGLDIDQQGTGTNSMGCNKCSQDPVKRPRGENVSPSVTITTAGSATVSGETATKIQSTAKDIVGRGQSVGACGDLSFGLGGVGFDVSGCVIATDTTWGFTESAGYGLQSSKSATVGLIFSNAQAVSQLSGWSVCGGLSGGAIGLTGGVTVCGGLTSRNGDFNGIVTVFPSAGSGFPGLSGELVTTYTWIQSAGSTPGWVRMLLPRTGAPDTPGTGPVTLGANSAGAGRINSERPGGYYDPGTPHV
jgi:RHS repeat-associated protein